MFCYYCKQATFQLWTTIAQWISMVMVYKTTYLKYEAPKFSNICVYTMFKYEGKKLPINQCSTHASLIIVQVKIRFLFNIWLSKEPYKKTDRPTVQKNRQTDKKTKCTERQTDRQTNRLNRQTNRQINGLNVLNGSSWS